MDVCFGVHPETRRAWDLLGGDEETCSLVIARDISPIDSPACDDTIFAPRIRPDPARTWTRANLSVSPSRMARSTDAISTVSVLTASPAAAASVDVIPTCATSGFV